MVMKRLIVQCNRIGMTWVRTPGYMMRCNRIISTVSRHSALLYVRDIITERIDVP